MDELCSACLCTGRKLYFINETGYENLYSQIINELPVYNMVELCVRICWECKALLRKLCDFKEQVKRSYTELTSFVQENSTKPLTNPRLQIYHIHSASYPQIIKEESELSPQEDEPVHEDDDYEVKSEGTHCEPETFVKDLCVEKEKRVKKSVKPIKEKSKRKLKIKKEVKTKSNSKQRITRTVENIIDSTVNDCYKQQEIKEDLEEKEIEKLETEIPVKKFVNNSKSEVKGSFSEKPVCGECGKTFSSRKTYRYHLNVLHKGQNRYPCPRCGKVYQWKSNLGRHMRSHKARDSDELYCETCDKRFASVATYRQHLKISRSHVSESEFSFMCTECGKKFVNKTRLRDHIDWEHLKKIKFKCQLCNKPFKCHTSLYVHMQNVHRSKDKKDNLCHVCGKSYQNAAKLKYHIVAMHTSETPYQCQQCNAAFGWYSSLYRHVREVHYKMKGQPKKSKKIKKTEILPPLLPVIPQQLLPQIHQPGPA